MRVLDLLIILAFAAVQFGPVAKADPPVSTPDPKPVVASFYSGKLFAFYDSPADVTARGGDPCPDGHLADKSVLPAYRELSDIDPHGLIRAFVADGKLVPVLVSVPTPIHKRPIFDPLKYVPVFKIDTHSFIPSRYYLEKDNSTKARRGGPQMDRTTYAVYLEGKDPLLLASYSERLPYDLPDTYIDGAVLIPDVGMVLAMFDHGVGETAASGTGTFKFAHHTFPGRVDVSAVATANGTFSTSSSSQKRSVGSAAPMLGVGVDLPVAKGVPRAFVHAEAGPQGQMDSARSKTDMLKGGGVGMIWAVLYLDSPPTESH